MAREYPLNKIRNIGSGLDCTNAAELLKYADSAIVSTSLKEGSAVDGERNVKPYGVRMDKTKIKKLMAVVSGLRKAHKSAQACEAGQRVE